MLESATCTKPIDQFELLVVDDQQAQLQSLQQLLHTSGYTKVELASNGDEAITKLQNNTPHLILLDLQMPGTNGLNVLEFHQQTGLDSVIIVISGETSFHWVKEAMRLGAHDFIRKPYKPEELLTTIEKALDQLREKRPQRTEEKFNQKPTIEPDTLSPEAIKRPETESGFQTPSQELAYPQAFFSPFFEQMNYLAGVLDRDMRLLEVNRRALEVIGQPASVVIGQPFINTPWWQEEDKPRLSEALARAATGQADTFVATHTNAEGRPLSVQFSVLPVNVGDERYITVTGLDISERIQHQRELAAQRRRLSDILEQAHVGTWKWNVQTGETLFSERWAEIIGYRLEELEPVSVETWKQLTHPDDLKASGKLLEKHFHGESPYYECEARMRHRDGHWVWVLDRGKIATWTDDGKPLLMSGINQDITERKQAEEALRESGTKYRRLIENTHDIIYSLTPEGVFTYASPAWTILLGHPVTEVEGHLFTEFVHPDDQPVCFAFLQKVLAGQRQEGVEYRIQHINGEWRWHTSNATPVKDTDGLVIGYEGISSDITKRKQTEYELTEQKNAYRSILSTTHDGFFVANKHGKILDVNPTYLTLSGYSYEEMLNMHISDFEAQERTDEVTRHIEKVMQVGSDIFESRHKRRDGSIWPVEISTTYSPLNGGRFFSFARDITERKQAEEALRESEKRFKKMFRNHSAVMLLIKPETGEIFDANDAAVKFYKYSREELLSLNICHINIFAPDVVAAERQAAIEENRNHFVFSHRLSDGEIRTVEVHSTPITGNGSSLLFSIVHDITGRKQAEEALKLERDSTRNILATVDAMIVALGPEGRITMVNRKACEILGYREDELFGQDWFASCLPHSIDVDQVRAVFKMALAGNLAGSEYYENPVRTRSGEERLIAWHNSSIRDKNGNTIGGLSAGVDITERKQAQLALEQKTIELQTKNSLLDSLSKTDQLTGIANRRCTQQIIEQEIDRFNRYKKPLCIFLFDIDHFKTVNDTHGHEVGDQVLVELVGVVQSVIRRTDTFGRWGGEEFILVCPETSLHTAQTVAGKICTTVREYEFTRGLGITLSIGVSEFQSGTNLKEILVEVDQKMYLAKQKGRDRVET